MHVDSELVQHFSIISFGEADYSDTSLVKLGIMCARSVVGADQASTGWQFTLPAVWGGAEEGA